MDHVNSGSKKLGFRKKGNKRCEPVENSSVAVAAAIHSLTAATSPGNSKDNDENVHSFVKNLQVCNSYFRKNKVWIYACLILFKII